MIEKLTHCILTGYQLKAPIALNPTHGSFIEYFHDAPGNVKVALPTLIDFINQSKSNHPILAGICRNAYEFGEEPPLITSDFISIGINNIPYPKEFKEKAKSFLNHLYKKGGKNFGYFEINSALDYPICYSNSKEEFERIMKYLKEKNLIQWRRENPVAGGMIYYTNVQLTDSGIEEVEQDLPKIPLIGLVNQEIATGDIVIDQQINHAKTLFFQEPQTLERMRSACETLSYVLEPLREVVRKFFNKQDIEAFFHIVNEFDIRHNKDRTKDIQHPEQFEWIFYSLLNTINTYTKLKNRLEK